jgi:glycosyltransferase involved in cell wall biosynthesis
MKILVLASRVPDRDGRADQRTVYRLLEFLARRGHESHLVALAPWDGAGRDPDSLAQLCATVRIFRQDRVPALIRGLSGRLAGYPFQVGAMWNPAMAEAVARLLGEVEFDLVYAHLIRTAEYVRARTAAPRILAMQVAQSLNLERMVQHRRSRFSRLFYRLELAAIRRYEPAIASSFDFLSVISVHDRDAMGLPADAVWLMPHGVDTDEFRPQTHESTAPGPVAFSGVLDTPTNIEAVRLLLEEIWPRVVARMPWACLQIVGRDPSRTVRRMARRAGVELKASVPSIAEHLAGAVMAVAPMRIAAGLQNKVLEAMASGLAVVATPEAIEGIGVRPGIEIVLAASSARFAEAVVRLLGDPERRCAIGRRARAFIEREWTWEHHWGRLEGRMLMAAAGANPSRMDTGERGLR